MRKRQPELEMDTATPALGLEDEIEIAVDPAAEAEADESVRRANADAKARLRTLKYEAQEYFGNVVGARGIRTPEQWAAALEKAGDEIGNGRFLVRQLGAERYLDPAIVAVLLSFRQNLIADIPHPTTADLMRVDAAVIGYYNMIRAQKWIGNLGLAAERELFGDEGLFEAHGEIVAERIEERLRRLCDVILPIQERAARMMERSLSALPRPARTRRSRGRSR